MWQLPSYFYPHEKEEKANISQALQSGAQKSDPNEEEPCWGTRAQSDLFMCPAQFAPFSPGSRLTAPLRQQ